VVEISNDDGTVTGVGYSYTGKLAFICFGPLSKFYSPILSTGGSMNLSIEERKKGSRSSIRKIQEEKATFRAGYWSCSRHYSAKSYAIWSNGAKRGQCCSSAS
jgi:hypothetical protein